MKKVKRYFFFLRKKYKMISEYKSEMGYFCWAGRWEKAGRYARAINRLRKVKFI